MSLFQKYKENKVFRDRVSDFISQIEPYFTEMIIKNLINISKAIQKLDPLIENKDFIKIREFKHIKIKQ